MECGKCEQTRRGDMQPLVDYIHNAVVIPYHALRGFHSSLRDDYMHADGVIYLSAMQSDMTEQVWS